MSRPSGAVSMHSCDVLDLPAGLDHTVGVMPPAAHFSCLIEHVRNGHRLETHADMPEDIQYKVGRALFEMEQSLVFLGGRA